MAAQVNSVLKNKKSKVTRKGKAATKKKPTNDTFLTVHYNNLVNDMAKSMNTYYGERIPDDLEGQVKFWKEKYERSEKQSDKYAAQVGVLERIISGALNRSCNGHE
jgi:hypothetical protein